jgi:hypothetical protein
VSEVKTSASPVILSEAKDPALEQDASTALATDFPVTGQMLHFVQHDRCRYARFVRSEGKNPGSGRGKPLI